MKRIIYKLISFSVVVVLSVTALGCGRKDEPPVPDILGTAQFVLDATGGTEWLRQKDIGTDNVWLYAANVKIEFERTLVELDEVDVVVALQYWQSVIGFLDGLVFGEEFERRNKINFVFDSSFEGTIQIDTAKNRFILNKSFIDSFLDPQELILNGAWQIFYELGRFYSTENSAYKGFVLSDNLSVSANMLALLASMNFTDRASRVYVGGVYGNERFLSQAFTMETAQSIDDEDLDYASLSDTQKLSMLALLVHRFGAEKMRQLLSGYSSMTEEVLLTLDDKMRRDEFLVRSSRVFGYDMRDFFDHFRLHNSFDARDKVSKMRNSTFYPVAVKGIDGFISFKMSEGRMLELEFSDSIMMLYGEGAFKSYSFERGVKSLDEPSLEESSLAFMPSVSSFDKIEVIVKTPSEAVKLSGGFRTTLADYELASAVRYDYSLNEALRLSGVNNVRSYPLSALLAIKIAFPLSMAVTAVIIILLALKKQQKGKTGRTMVR